MASFNGSGSNSRQGINHLNVTPSDYELMQQQQQELFNIEEDLALFTDTQFFDWDMGGNAQSNPQSFHASSPHQPIAGFDVKSDEFINGGDFSIQQYNLPTLAPHPHPTASHQNPQQAYTQQPASALSPHNVESPASNTSSSFTTTKGQRIQSTASALSGKGVNGSETPGTYPTSPSSDDPSRAAAEEDKRRRNTAASARFRVKKKQREQALEKTAKEMTDRVTELENRVGQLEMENKLLKDLLTEKSGKEVDVAELRRKLEAKAGKGGIKAEI